MMNDCYEITVASFLKNFREFTNIGTDETTRDALITDFLNEAECNLSQGSFGNFYNQAVLFYAAHNLSLYLDRITTASIGQSVIDPNSKTVLINSRTSAVISDSVGALSNSYATTKTMTSGNTRDNYFLTTYYGVRYLNLKQPLLPIVRFA